MTHSQADISKGLWLGLLGTLMFAVPLLGERLDAVTVGFGLAVIATVFIGKKMPVNAASSRQLPSEC